jgi:hypothetical protein
VVRQCFWALLLGGCAFAHPATPPVVVEAPETEPSGDSEWDREAPGSVGADEASDDGAVALPEFLRGYAPSLSPSLLGTAEARWPGLSTRVDAGFGRVRVTAKVHAGFVYTEVEEELLNDGNAQVEVAVSFRAPTSGVIVRMGLWVDDRLIDAEVVERRRAASVYEGIVQRSRDPALLERDPSRALKLRVFPVPAHGSRRVVVGYVQPLERRDGRYDLDLGLQLAQGAPPIRALSVEIELGGVSPEQLAAVPGQSEVEVEPGSDGTRVSWRRSNVRPADWRLSFAEPARELAEFAPANATGAERFVALRVTPDLEPKVAER